MRYVRPREYPLNPRAPIDLLDEVVERFQYSRRTFTGGGGACGGVGLW